MKIENRDELLAVRVKPKEMAWLENEATERGLRVSEYVRKILFAGAVFTVSDGKK